MKLRWNPPGQRPEDRTILLVIINGQVEASIWLYDAKRGTLVSQMMTGGKLVDWKLKLSEIEGWIALGDLPLPSTVTKRSKR